MSKATAGDEIPKLAEKHGFRKVAEHSSSVAYGHLPRREGFTLYTEDGAFDSAKWHAPTEYRTIVDRRAPGEYGKEGRSLTSNGKRRSVGMSDVRVEMIASTSGLEVGYLELKKRIRDKDWREQ